MFETALDWWEGDVVLPLAKKAGVGVPYMDLALLMGVIAFLMLFAVALWWNIGRTQKKCCRRAR